MLGDAAGPSPNIIRTGAPVLESNHTHVAAGGLVFGTGTRHQSTVCAFIQLSGDEPEQTAFDASPPNQFVGSDHPMSTTIQSPELKESCVWYSSMMYHHVLPET